MGYPVAGAPGAGAPAVTAPGAGAGGVGVVVSIGAAVERNTSGVGICGFRSICVHREAIWDEMSLISVRAAFALVSCCCNAAISPVARS